MVPFLFFLLFFAVLAGVTYGLTVARMGRAWAAAGPARVGAAVRGRNRAILVFTAVVLVVIAVLEALVADVSAAVENLQYRVGDAVAADPALIIETGNGSVSWGLYLGIVLGVLLGVMVGTFAATRRYPVLRALTVRDVI